MSNISPTIISRNQGFIPCFETTPAEVLSLIFDFAVNDNTTSTITTTTSIISLVCKQWHNTLQYLMRMIVKQRWPHLFEDLPKNWISIYIHKIKIEENVIRGRFQFSEFCIPRDPLESSNNPFYPLRGRFIALERKTKSQIPTGPHLFRKQLDIIDSKGKTTKIIEINHKYALNDRTLYLDKGNSIVAYDIHSGDLLAEYQGFSGKIRRLKIRGIYLEARTSKFGLEFKENKASFENERYYMWDVTTGRLLAEDCEKSQLPPSDRLPDDFGWRFIDRQFEHRGLSFVRRDSIWTIQKEGQPFADESIRHHKRDIYYFAFTENSILIMLHLWNPRNNVNSQKMKLEEWDLESNLKLNECEISKLDLTKRINLSRYSFISHALYLGNNRLSLILEDWSTKNNNSIVILDTKTGNIVNQANHSNHFHLLSIHSWNFSELTARFPTYNRPGSKLFFGVIDYSKVSEKPEEFTISNDEATEVLSATHQTHTLAITKIKDVKIAVPSNLEKWGAFAKRKFHRLAKNLKIFTLFLATLSINCALAIYQRLKNLKQG